MNHRDTEEDKTEKRQKGSVGCQEFGLAGD
jgi:hypothetical protein